MAYLTIEELKSSPGLLPEIRDSEDISNLEFLLEFCSFIIDSYTGTTFKNESDKTIYVDGNGSNKLFLPNRIFNIKSVSTFDNTIEYSLKDLVICDNNNSILSRTYDFPAGDQNIKVFGDFGWELVPKDVILSLVLLCNSYYFTIRDEDILQKISGPFSAEKIGNYSYQLRDRLNKVTGEEMSTTGDFKVDQLLDKYKIDRIGFEVI